MKSPGKAIFFENRQIDANHTMHDVLKSLVSLLEKDHIGNYSIRGVINFALVTRLLLACSMVVSCALLPNFNAGNDVHVFDMRLNLLRDSLGTMRENSLCFCLEGHACEVLFSSSSSSSVSNDQGISIRDNYTKDTDDPARRSNDISWHPKCMDTKNRNVTLRSINIYNMLLSPFTRWDAARFLTIAVDPRVRYPRLDDDDMLHPECLREETGGIDAKDICQVRYGDDEIFASSEQAHAFFPLFPLILRYLSLFLATVIPESFLPPTYEALVVISGVLWNAFAFTVSAVAFHHLTSFILCSQCREDTTRNEALQRDIVRIANLATILYCLNPANIFFVTCYSESTFSLFTWFGHYFFQRSQKYPTTTADSRGILYRLGWLWCSTISWALASYTRSNGSLISIFIFIHLCGVILNNQWRSMSCFKNYFSFIIKICGTILVYSMSILIVIVPMVLHDQRGIHIHCANGHLHNRQKPHWCTIDGDGSRYSRFSLYRYVQKAHWNVGFLNYWELKQIPNFVLAFPILFLSFNAVIYWIQKSWNEFSAEHARQTTRLSVGNIVKWSFISLSKLEGIECQPPDPNKKSGPLHHMLAGSKALAHYALLAAFTCLGTFIAHVQISTRMICSSCPAIYWYMSLIILGCDIPVGSKAMTDAIVICYLLSFHVLSVIFHVNWLPWT
jgi:phosphatidylinositol glycan class V